MSHRLKIAEAEERQRERERQRKRRRERRQKRRREKLRRYYAQPTYVGRIPFSTFRRALPAWWTGTLVRWRGILLEKTAMRSLMKVYRIVGRFFHGGGYRSHGTQIAMSGKAGVATPGFSYHEIGIAIDFVTSDGRLFQVLKQHGWHQLPSEWWHWSFREAG